MSRINTNVSSLIAQKTLGRSNAQLQETLVRLSTGLRINAGKDDPAGLIASENLRRDITSANKAISNTERATQLIGTADSALGQISGLLNEIRGLVVEAANSGVLSSEQIAANQLQVDSSLEAIDRIAQVTTFQGRKLLDGSLDFQVGYTTGQSTVRDLSIQQANLGTLSSLSVSVDVTTAATQALVTNTGGFDPSAASQASGSVTLTDSAGTLSISATAAGAADGLVGNTTDVVFQAAADIAQSGGTLTLTGGTIDVDAIAGGAADGVAGDATDIILQADAGIVQASGTFALANGGFDIAAIAGTSADGTQGNGVIIDVQWAAAATSASYNAGTNTITIVANDGGTTTVNDLATAVDGLAEFSSSNVTTGGGLITAGDDNTYNGELAGGLDGTTSAAYNAGTSTITVSLAANATITQLAAAIDGLADFSSTATAGGASQYDFTDNGPYNGELTGGSDGTTGAVYAGNVITVDVALNATVANVATAIDGLADFAASATAGSGNAFATTDFGTTNNPLTGGAAAATSNVLTADLVIKLSGQTGAEVFTFEAGATIAQVASAINLVSDSIGVEAADNGGVLELRSTGYGTAAFVDVEVLEEGVAGGFEAGLSATRTIGTDIIATVNGTTANGAGNTLSLNTATLDLSLTVADGSSTDVSFSINGGGAIFQIGPNVVSNNQVRVGVGSVNTASLGGIDGRLYELRSGNDSDLSTDPTTAASIVDSSINKVTGLRGRLGAFQRTTLETNIASLQDTVTNLTDAESSIRDADFAQETAKLTRAQILVQSGTAVLQIANQNPQNVLGLLRG
ncbi:MAG: flagellin [Pirellulaceae bacterium]